MDALFVAIELSAPSRYMREDEYAYFTALIFHAFGMAALCGGLVAFGTSLLRRPGAGDRRGLRGLRPLVLAGAVIATLSGLLLLVAYPAKALTNPLFALKLACLVAAALLFGRLDRSGRAAGEVAVAGERGQAAALIAVALGSVVAGKLLLHTARILTVS